MSATLPYADPAHDILRDRRQPLNAIFNPESVAVIGATERPGSVGRTVLWNLISSPFGGTVFPINPKRHSILGIRAYPDVAAVPEAVDLAIIVIPAPAVPGVLEECAAVGVKGAIVLSAGFKEIGPEGVELERKVLDIARRAGIRLVGPNCLGVMNPIGGLNATFASTIARPGNVGFISQSGALCTSILDWSIREHVGFSAFVSIGSMLDVGWGDLIDYLGDDPNTHSIAIYMESVGDARSFLSAAREVALRKPIVVIKAGRTEAAAKAAASHTGALAGSDEVLNAAFDRCGVLRVDRLAHLFFITEVLAKQPRPKGPRLTVITNAGGPGVLTTDTLISGGGKLTELAPETIEALNQVLPAQWSHGNPIDILGDADPDRYAKALDIVANDPNSDGLLAVLTPQAMTDPTRTAEALVEFAQKGDRRKPLLASWMGGENVAAGADRLAQADIPIFPYPDIAARMFNYMWQYDRNVQSLYETPRLSAIDSEESCDRVERILETARKDNRTILTEFESKQVLAAYGIPVVPTHIAHTEAEAVAAAETMDYPVVLKLLSDTITHKSDVGGVQLNLPDAEAVRRAFCQIRENVTAAHSAADFGGVTVQPMVQRKGYEAILGSSLDPQFGPVLLFGTGGTLVEVFRDRALALPPLTTTLARRMMEKTKLYRALQGVRGQKPVDIEALAQILVRFSQLAIEQPWIAEIDINPMLLSADGILALDARVLLHSADTDLSSLPRPAVRSYPHQYATSWRDRAGEECVIRPIRPEDEDMAVNFHRSLSEESVYLRYAHSIKLSRRLAHDRLARLCFIDYDREIALIAVYNTDDGQDLAGVARLSRLHGDDDAEFSLLVSDTYQRRGLGTELLDRLIDVARQEGITALVGDILPSNDAMQRICKRLGFELSHPQDDMVKAHLNLTAAPVAAR